ncbi:MAG: binding-protein-dependent transport system inner rane component [Acidimicrobiaceae bacterium]|nr:binding-protein-dependent transport system inner rane component [Acidimicrobiaceae bacterium]
MTSVVTWAPETPRDAAPSGPRRRREGLRRLAGSPSARTLGRRATQLGRPVLWLSIILLILAPCACFLVLAVSPRLFSQGSQWFTLSYLRAVFTGGTAVALLDSIWVSCAAAGMGLLIGFPIAWLANRTTLPGRRFVAGAMWFVLLLPSWLPALGWQRLVQPDGVMYRIGLDFPFVTHAIMGPFGVVLLLGLRCVPFTYLAISAALAGLGQEFEDAARVHGASRSGAIRLVAPILAPAITSALAIGFAETVSDFGVASTLAYTAHFPLATYQLYADINGFPPSFSGAAAIGWLLVASVAVPLALQARALRGRSYAVLSGRTRPVVRRELRGRAKAGAIAFLSLFYLMALGVPGFGAISSSLLADFGTSLQLTFSNYRLVFESSGLAGPLERSLIYGAITASVTVVGGFVFATLLAKKRTKSTKVLDFLLLAAVALPSVVFAAGYIFAYNLPILSRIGINIYQTVTLLVLGYVASSLPTNARVLVGAVSQVQRSLHEAGRAHGAGSVRAWIRGVFPVLSRPLTMAWLLTFCGIFLELPISQLLYAPSSPPVSVAIQDNLGNYHFGTGMAQAVVAVLFALVAVAIVLGGYRLLAPKGWRRIGGGARG